MKEDSQDSFIGRIIGDRYRITECLAKGGMGVVFKGERLQLGRPVAIKFLQEPLSASPEFLARFEREAKAMSQLSHPNCVSVIDFGVDESPFIVMDFVTGTTLRQVLDDGPVATGRAVHIAKQLLAALAHAHKQGIIHRDIKPDNIMISEATGMGDHVRIFDFGLAKLMDPVSENNLSRTDTAMGTPNYMSPEQTVGNSADARSDLYTTGVVLFELLAGSKPFYDENPFKVMRMHRDSAPPTLTMVGSGKVFSREIEFVVAKALEKQPEKRFQSAKEFAEALATAPESKLAPIAFETTPDGGLLGMATVSLGVTPDEPPQALKTHAPVDKVPFAPTDARPHHPKDDARWRDSHLGSAFLIALMVGALGLGFVLREKLGGLFFSSTSGVDTRFESLKQRINDSDVSGLKSKVLPGQEPATVLPGQEPATVLPGQEPATVLPGQ
ncbi:MAG: protein kinase, partial [Myxococcota bacterium]|nr:protein kinase [Myxococcota bacterium]